MQTGGRMMSASPSYQPAHPESVFTYGAPPLRFGSGAADDAAVDAVDGKALGVGADLVDAPAKS